MGMLMLRNEMTKNIFSYEKNSPFLSNSLRHPDGFSLVIFLFFGCSNYQYLRNYSFEEKIQFCRILSCYKWSVFRYFVTFFIRIFTLVFAVANRRINFIQQEEYCNGYV